MGLFKEKVYKVVSSIPKGKTLSYKEVAIRAGSPNAYRAIGNILNKNINFKIPCHRVIKSDGSFGGDKNGEKRKKEILKREGVVEFFLKKGYTFTIKNKKMKKIKNAKNALLPSTFFLASFYFSIFFLFGIIFGYWVTHKFCRKYLDSGKINSIHFNFGDWNLHLHHWLTGTFGLFFVWFLNGFYNIPQIIFGALGGVIVHDLHTDKVWHKVIYKKDGK